MLLTIYFQVNYHWLLPVYHILPQTPISLILKVTNQPVGYFSLAYLTNIITPSPLCDSAPLCEKNQKKR